MRTAQRVWLGIKYFVPLALIGPAMGELRKILQDLHLDLIELPAFIYDLKMYMWPTFVTALLAYGQSATVVSAVALTANLLFFVLLGAAVGYVAKSQTALLLAYVLLLTFLLIYAWIRAAEPLTFLSPPAFVVALALYGLPFLFIARKLRALERSAGQS